MLLNIDPYEGTKPAYVWAYGIHPYEQGYPGVHADLFFSSREKFNECWLGNPPDDVILVPVTVPKDFTDWDYIPEDY